MEVMDSHMSEHFSAQAPTHIDIDMSAEYDDDTEYAMHDITEATTNDEEIYDAEFEHTEVEMDEYADEVEVVEDDETHMGTYVPTDDAATVTDVTVEDVQLLSSPVPAGIPQGATMRPISPHAAADADLPLNEAPGKVLAEHSPHSVATLVDDSEIEHLQADAAKDSTLNEVIDLTENDEEPQIAPVDSVEEAVPANPVDPVDQALPQSEHEVAQDNADETEQEFYEAEESIDEIPSTDPTATDQPTEQQEDEQHTDQHEPAAEVPAYLEIPEPNDQDGHSPIEEALVINQQVRDDAADSMEPSPPIRLYYRDESKGTDEIFEIFTSTGLEPHETTALLFWDNRTLFYEPLSGFFAQLRETEYFSGDGWETTEMGLRMDLGDSNISINEDHKQTDNVSLFKLSFIWSGLGSEGPLELTLVRRSERFVAQFARLVEQVEQRDLENVAEPPKVQHEAEIGGNPEINSGDIENDDSEPVLLENSSQEGGPKAPINPDETPGDPPRGTHENEGTPTTTLQREREEPDEQHQGVDGPDDETENNAARKESTQNSPTYNQNPTTQGTKADGTGPSLQGGEDNTASNGQSPSTATLQPQDDEYDEYAEGVNDLTPAQTFAQDGVPTAGWDVRDYEYEEDYDGADEEHDKRVLPDGTPNEAIDSDHAPPPPAPKFQEQDPLQSVGLKRNLDELEYEEYATTPSAPSSPGSDNKRVKHVSNFLSEVFMRYWTGLPSFPLYTRIRRTKLAVDLTAQLQLKSIDIVSRDPGLYTNQPPTVLPPANYLIARHTVCGLYNPPLLHDLYMPTMLDETHDHTNCDTPPRTPELIDENSSSAESAESGSEYSVSPSLSPSDSLFSDAPFVPDLRGPEPDEEPQFRGRRNHAVKEANPLPPHIEPQLAPAIRRAGGANPAVAEGTVPIDPTDVPPNPPDQA
ncbi:unnamed protein product [Rhizoctonia solani]|uniref:Uncharacterized protein n=1 Tax=Rhizoctonia solani TaxID=456999 RepID=A0A8H3CIW1_9AGAM|nr:unnamed protein product [Rhizoctonia solani]